MAHHQAFSEIDFDLSESKMLHAQPKKMIAIEALAMPLFTVSSLRKKNWSYTGIDPAADHRLALEQNISPEFNGSNYIINSVGQTSRDTIRGCAGAKI